MTQSVLFQFGKIAEAKDEISEEMPPLLQVIITLIIASHRFTNLPFSSYAEAHNLRVV